MLQSRPKATWDRRQSKFLRGWPAHTSNHQASYIIQIWCLLNALGNSRLLGRWMKYLTVGSAVIKDDLNQQKRCLFLSVLDAWSLFIQPPWRLGFVGCFPQTGVGGCKQEDWGSLAEQSSKKPWKFRPGGWDYWSSPWFQVGLINYFLLLVYWFASENIWCRRNFQIW